MLGFTPLSNQPISSLPASGGAVSASISQVSANLVLTGGTQIVASNITSGLVAYWKLDETPISNGSTVADSSGYGNTGTLVTDNGATNKSTTGKLSNAMTFDGTSDSISVANSSSLGLTTAWSFQIWFKAAALGQSNKYLLSRPNTGLTDNVYAVPWSYHSNAVSIYLGAGAAHGYPTDGDITLADTNWHHIIYTYDGTTLNGYLDGSTAFAGISWSSFTATSSTAPFYIGDFAGSNSFSPNGVLDEIGIWNRALTSSEVTSLYNSGSGLAFPFTGGGAVSASVTQVAANLTLTGGTQAVASTQVASVAQVAANLTLTGGTQTVASVQTASISQVAANLTLTGGTQSVASSQIAAVSQTSANLVLTGGTQAVTTGSVVNGSVTQVAATLTLTGGTQTVASIQNASITQVSANLTLSGGTQSVASVQNASITQTSANLTLTSGTQSVASVQSAAIAQVAALLTLSGGLQSVSTVNIASVTQTSANLVLTGGTQTVSSSSGTSVLLTRTLLGVGI